MYIAGLRALCDLVNLMAFKTCSDLGIICFSFYVLEHYREAPCGFSFL